MEQMHPKNELNQPVSGPGNETPVINETPIKAEISKIADESKKKKNALMQKIEEVYKSFTHIKSESDNK